MFFPGLERRQGLRCIFWHAARLRLIPNSPGINRGSLRAEMNYILGPYFDPPDHCDVPLTFSPTKTQDFDRE